MFGNNYYCLVAGLKEYALDSDAKGFDARAIIDEIKAGVSKEDARTVDLLYGYYDCESVAARRSGRAATAGLGNLTDEELDGKGNGAPEWMASVVRAFDDPEGEDAETVDTSAGFAQALLAAYYGECARSKSRFLREWSEFDRNLRNVVAALKARAMQLPVENVVVGSGDVAEQLARSSAADFGLKGELTYIDALIAASEEQNLLEKEHKIDKIRWDEADELSWSDYFDIDAVLAYLVKINIVARWMRLDEKRGREMLGRLTAELDGKELINKQ